MTSLYRRGLVSRLSQTSYKLPTHTEDWRTSCSTCRHSVQRPWEFLSAQVAAESAITWLCQKHECQVGNKGPTACSLARSSAGACGPDAAKWQAA